MNDKRSYIIKKILKQRYPTAHFRVRIEKYSMGESINVRTDLVNRGSMKCYPCNKDYKEGYARCPQCNELTHYINETEKTRRDIEAFLKDFEKVSYDEYSGEILSGGNTFLFVEPLF